MKAIKVTLIQDAYLDDDGDYTALAILGKNEIDNTDDEESGYPVNCAKVRWNTVDGFDGEDESNACDWSNPEGVKFNGQWIADKFEGVNNFKNMKIEYYNTDGSRL